MHALAVSPLGLVSALDFRSFRSSKTVPDESRKYSVGSPETIRRLIKKCCGLSALRPSWAFATIPRRERNGPQEPGDHSSRCSSRLTYFLLPASGISAQNRFPDLRASVVEFSHGPWPVPNARRRAFPQRLHRSEQEIAGQVRAVPARLQETGARSKRSSPQVFHRHRQVTHRVSHRARQFSPAGRGCVLH